MTPTLTTMTPYTLGLAMEHTVYTVGLFSRLVQSEQRSGIVRTKLFTIMTGTYRHVRRPHGGYAVNVIIGKIRATQAGSNLLDMKVPALPGYHYTLRC